ncbi:hypothetical protein EZV62_006385 [Acer yangbiense]|uniref:TF-B3 domain-containing protein n=1 Tax=Acer yangbiense TaxID=1000413 RepID=A0A5C7I722_9ROSI|nr:hypothetical protein EZV62_006385 [Acer yangbiense]
MCSDDDRGTCRDDGDGIWRVSAVLLRSHHHQTLQLLGSSPRCCQDLDELDEVSKFDWLGCNTQHVLSVALGAVHYCHYTALGNMSDMPIHFVTTIGQRGTEQIQFSQPGGFDLSELIKVLKLAINFVDTNILFQFKISKLLTISDITTKVVLRNKIMKHIQIPQGINFVDLQVMDSTKHMWTLRLYIRPAGYRGSPVFTVWWLQFVRAKHLKVGDKLIFSWHQVRAADGELQMQYKIQVGRKSDVNYQGEPVYLDVENFL